MINKLLLILLLTLSCGTRKKTLNKEVQEVKTEQKTDLQQEKKEVLNLENISFSEGEILNKDFIIHSKGQDFDVQFKDFKFKGNADIQFHNGKIKTETKTETLVNNVIENKTKYITITQYKSIYKTKKLDVKSEKPMAWLYVTLFLLGIVIGVIGYYSLDKKLLKWLT